MSARLPAALLLSIAITLAGTTGTAAAQPLRPPSSPVHDAEPAPAPRKDRGTALAWSVGVTVGGWAVSMLGTKLADEDQDHEALGLTIALVGTGAMLVGPSAGHIYAGEYGHAGGMTALRVGGVGLMVYGLVELLDCFLCDSEQAAEDDGDGAGAALMLVGTGLYLGGTIYDLVDAPRAADRANRRAAARLMVTPTAIRGRDGVVPALGLAGSF